MPRFTVKEVLIATTLIAVGIGILVSQLSQLGGPTELGDGWWALLVMVAFALVGMGFGTLFRRRLIGAYLMIMLLVVIITVMRWIVHW
jgi:hypothetical protein